MISSEIHLERLVGVVVRDVNGESAGPIEEIVAVQRDGTWLVSEFLTGPVRGVSRLGELQIALWLIGLLGGAKSPEGGYRIPWSQLDLSAPTKPRLRCSISELRRVR